jgi:hypothetical protein
MYARLRPRSAGGRTPPRAGEVINNFLPGHDIPRLYCPPDPCQAGRPVGEESFSLIDHDWWRRGSISVEQIPNRAPGLTL